MREGLWLLEASPLASFRDEQFRILNYRAFAGLELRTRDRRDEATGQSPRFGASRIKRTVHIDVCDLGATPPR